MNNKVKIDGETVSINNIRYQGHMGLEAGAVASLKLYKMLDLRFSPGFSYFQTDVIYDKKILDYYHITNKVINESDTIRMANPTYLNFPLAIKFNAIRFYNHRPYLTVFGCYSWNFNSDENSTYDNFKKIFRTKSQVFSYGFSLGIDWYLHYFKASSEISILYGINDILVKDGEAKNSHPKQSPWTDSFAKIKMRGWSFKIIFQ